MVSPVGEEDGSVDSFGYLIDPEIERFLDVGREIGGQGERFGHGPVLSVERDF